MAEIIHHIIQDFHAAADGGQTAHNGKLGSKRKAEGKLTLSIS